MNLFSRFNAWLYPNKQRKGPPQQTLPVTTLHHMMTHPACGIVSVESVLQPPSNMVRLVPSIAFTFPGHEYPRPTRTFDRGDNSLVEFCPEFFRPDRSIRHI